MRSVRLAAVLTALAGALLLVAAPVSAGGPTSVLLVSPAHGATASLYASDDQYAELQSALASDPVAGEPLLGSGPGIGGSQIVVTWLIHDVQPWRVDRINLDADGMPARIHTQESIGGRVDLGSGGVWHRPADPAALADLLVELGVLDQHGIRPIAEDPGAETDDETASDAAPAAGAPAQPPAGDGGPAAGAAWALPAVAGGIAVGVLGDRWLRRRRDRDDGGRWQLVDVPTR